MIRLKEFIKYLKDSSGMISRASLEVNVRKAADLLEVLDDVAEEKGEIILIGEAELVGMKRYGGGGISDSTEVEE